MEEPIESPVGGARQRVTAKHYPRHFSARMLAATLFVTTLAGVPVFLLGSLAIFVRDDLGFSAAALGAAVSTYYVAAALSAAVGGRIVERIGAQTGMAVSAVVSGLVLIALGVLTRQLTHVVTLMAIGGISNSLALPSTNLALARGIRHGRQGLAFGIKTAAHPIATLGAGMAVPLLGATVGWRWAFVAIGSLGFAIYLIRPPQARVRIDEAGQRFTTHPDMPLAAMIVVAMAACAGFGPLVAIGVFYVEAMVAHGITSNAAGTMLAVASVAGILTRISLGWLADRTAASDLRLVIPFVALGSVGALGLALGRGVPIVLAATLLTYICGWGWNGLLVFAVVRLNPRTPAAATGILATGVSVGGIAMPALFGVVVERFGYGWAFTGSAAMLLLSTVLLATVAAMIAARGRDDSMPTRRPA